MTHKGELLTIKGEITAGNMYTEKDIFVHYFNDYKPLTEITDPITGSRHPFFRMIFNHKGNTWYTSADAINPFSVITANQHNLLFIHPDQVYIKSEEASGNDIICIDINSDFLQRYLPAEHNGYRNLVYGLKNTAPALFSLQHMHITPQINAALQSLHTFTHSGFCGKLLLQSKVIELLALQMSQFNLLEEEQNVQQLDTGTLTRMHTAREILISNLSEELSLIKLTHLVGTNEFNLKKDFKAAFGNTVFGYLKAHKMEKARSLLMERKITIAAISSKIGYKHATHFSSAFKKHFGYLPNKIKMMLLLLDPQLILSEVFALIVEI